MPKPSLPWTILLSLAFVSGGFAIAQAEAGSPVTEVGQAVGQPSIARIGPEGGEVRSPDGALTVTFPPGALAEETEVGVQFIVNHAPLGIGAGYRLAPAGESFSVPVTLTFRYDEGVLAGQPPEFLWFISQGADGGWNPQRSSVVDTEAGTLTVEVAHFSDWAVGRFIDLKLEPSESVVMPGESVKLAITGFLYDPDRDDNGGLVPLDDALVALTEGRQLLDSTERFNGFQVRNWRLNGVDAPVDNANGELIMLERRALYTAPATAPNPSTVAVSVDLRATRADDSWHQYTLVANITVHSAEYYLRLNGLDGQLLFIGGDGEGAEERHAADARVLESRLQLYADSSIDGASLGLLVLGGTTPGTYPLPPLDPALTVTYAPRDHDHTPGTYLYVPYYYDMVEVIAGFCAPAAFVPAPFSVTIDRIETLDDSGDEVIFGSFAGTVYADAPAEWALACQAPPSLSAQLSGTFKLPLSRLDGSPGMGEPDDEPWQDEEEDEDLVPLAPLG